MTSAERRSIRLLAPFVTRHWRALAASAASTVVLIAAELAQPWPLKIVIDRLLPQDGGPFDLSRGDVTLLAGLAALVIAIAAAGAISSYWSDVLLNRAGERIVHDLRVAVYAHLQRLSLGFHDRRSKGDLVTRVTGDVNAIGTLFSDSLGAVASAVLLLAGMAAVSFMLDPLLALVTFAVTPVLGFVTFRYRRKIKDLARLQRAEEGEIASLAAEALSAMRVVKAFRSEGYEFERVQERSELRRRIGVEAARAEARFSALVDVLGAAAATIVLVLGVYRVAAGALTAGSLVVFAAYAARTYKPLRELARQSAKISRAGARAERLAELLATDEALPERARAYTGGRAAGAIEFDHVTFRYGDRPPALRDASLRLDAGSRVAVVGPSGAGKSTLAALVARFYDPDDGAVRLDGRDARDCALTWLRDQVGILLQDTVLFRGTVSDNIAYGSTATRDEVVAAARVAGADGFVSALPDGYETELGAGGVGLSGGQRQRLGIARVLLRDPPILVLDEPTTGLDAASEAQLLLALERLMSGRTTLLVTHSIALARRADRVVVLDNGRVVEDDAPAQLLERQGLFRELAAHQDVSRRRPHARDRRLPKLGSLLDADEAMSLLERAAGSALSGVRPTSVRYKPGRRAVVTYDAVVDGRCRNAVAIADTKADLAAVARSVNGGRVVFDERARVLVQWLPYDLALPLLREKRLALRLRRLELDVDPGAPVRRLGYKPLGRVVLGVGDHVVKGYGDDAKFSAAARALELAQTTGVDTAAREALLPRLRATVQAAVRGKAVTDDARLAGPAASLLRQVHAVECRGLQERPPARHLRAAVEAADVVAAIAPELEPRVAAVLRRLEATLPEDTELVFSHGDFEVGQLLEHDSRLWLLDFDELCAAPRALDIATYAAHTARAGGGAGAAVEVAETMVEAYGVRPEGLAPYLAASILIRAPSPFRKLEDGWRERVEALVAAAEEVAGG